MVFRINRGEYADQEEYINSGRRCGALIPSPLQVDRVRQEVAAVRRAVNARPESVSINVQFTHITDGNRGPIQEQQRRDQIEILNKAYSNSGIKFTYEPSSVRTVNKPAWFHMGQSSAAEREAKTELQVPPEYNLNVYTAELQAGLLGWATFPYDLLGNRVMDGVVILWTTFPGGTEAPYNLGHVCTHQIGHWLGLWHTFQGGCMGIDGIVGDCDLVVDTPAHERPNFGCPSTGRNGACSTQEVAPVHNYMNFTDDACMTEFTKGQFERIQDQIQTYRPGLIIGPDIVVAASDRG
jgi:Pregnancy-associated plasma protein-A